MPLNRGNFHFQSNKQTGRYNYEENPIFQFVKLHQRRDKWPLKHSTVEIFIHQISSGGHAQSTKARTSNVF